jgi:hypothetical protein
LYEVKNLLALQSIAKSKKFKYYFLLPDRFLLFTSKREKLLSGVSHAMGVFWVVVAAKLGIFVKQGLLYVFVKFPVFYR